MFVNPVSLSDLAATEKLAARLAPMLQRGDMLALQGNLGAGKTTFARALLKSLGLNEDVPSPTFTLLQSYDAPAFPIYHFDLYRLKSPDELEELGWDDALADGLTIAEWAEKAGVRLPRDRLELQFEMDKTGQRHCRFKPHGAWADRLGKMT